MSVVFSFEDFIERWEERPVVIPDTNIILDLYRFSSHTCEHILELLQEIQDQIWIPHQVLAEYVKNYREVKANALKKYGDVTEKIQTIIQKARNEVAKQLTRYSGFRFPKINELEAFINTKISEIEVQAKEFGNQIRDEIENNERMIQEDKVKKFMDQMVENGKVGRAFTYSEKMSLYAEGDARYARKIPPGYMDIKKDKKDNTLTQKFGDLFVWKQILEYARQSQRPILFISKDKKEDWWELDGDGNPIRPRTELLEEFRDYSNQTFTMVSLAEFDQHVSKIINKENTLSYLELNATSVAEDLIEKEGWDLVLNGDGDLTRYLIHSGELQEYVSDPISDVEPYEFSNAQLEIDYVDSEESSVVMEGTFSITVEASISESAFSDHDYSSDAVICIRGSITLEFDIDLEGQFDNNIIEDTVHISVGGFEIDSVQYTPEDDGWEEKCVICNRKNPSHQLSNGDPICENCSSSYEVCPNCGLFFEKGELAGAFCVDCENNL